jgi:hypothetical protein
MKGNISTGFALSVIVILALVFGGVFWLMGKRNIADTSVVETMQPISNAVQQPAGQTIPQPDKVVYENKEFGFSLELPASWKGYMTYEVKGSFGQKYITFLLPAKENDLATWLVGENMPEYDYYAPIVDIVVDTKINFTKERASEKQDCIGKTMGTSPDCPIIPVIGEVGKYVVYGHRVDAPPPADFDDKVSAVGDIANFGFADFLKKGFKLINQTSIDTSDWQTYRNEQYGFEIRYPQNYKEESWNNGQGTGFVRQPESSFVKDSLVFLVSVSSTPWPTFEERYTQARIVQNDIKNKQAQDIGPGDIVRRLPYKETLTLSNGIRAEKILEQDPVFVDYTPWVTILFYKDNAYFQVEMLSGNSVSKSEIDQFNTFVNSLNF